MADWYVARQGQQQGPFKDNACRQMIANGEVSAEETVWREGMAQWTPAGRVPELAALFPAAPQTVAYSQPFSDHGLPALTDRGMELLRQTRPWVRLVSVMIFIATGFMALAGVMVVVLGAAGVASNSGAAATGGVAMAFVGVFYLVFAALYFMPGLYLSRYASRIADLLRMRREDQLEQALAAQKSFWKFVGILILIMIVLWLVMIAVMVVGGIAASTLHGPTFTPAPQPRPFHLP